MSLRATFADLPGAALSGALQVYDMTHFWAPLALGAAIVIGLDAAKRDALFPGVASVLAGIPGALIVLLYFALPPLASRFVGRPWALPGWHGGLMLLELFAGVVVGIWWLRHGVRRVDAWQAKNTAKTTLERNRKTDVRRIGDFLPTARPAFDPRKFYDLKRGIFVGLDENDKPIYLPWSLWRNSHILLSGRTRSGKGITLQALIEQAIMHGEFVVFLDPKGDNFMPHVFREACAAGGVDYVYLDVNQTAPAQFNIAEGCDVETLENMLVAGFSLTEKGTDADHFRLADRAAARQAARWLAANPGRTMRDALLALGDNWIEEAKGFHSYMLEFAEISAVNRSTPGGIDIHALEQRGGCLYVVGDMMAPTILRIQRMILLRLLFLAKKRRNAEQEPRQICVVADEFKCHISRPFMTSLGASAGWWLHAILAFQSLQDLADCPADLDPDSVRGSVMENCAIQLSYAIKDIETAEWLAASTGTILVDDESRKVDKNLGLAETVDGERTLRQSERYYVDTNMICNLPTPDRDKKTIGCGVLSVPGQLAKFCFTSPIEIKRTAAGITPTHAEAAQPAAAAPAPAPASKAKPKGKGKSKQEEAQPEPTMAVAPATSLAEQMVRLEDD